MNKINYDQLMTEEMQKGAGKSLLLHSCCAPCSSACLERVANVFQTTVFYYNPNLNSEEEYEKRKSEQLRFMRESGLGNFLECGYQKEDFEEIARGFEREPEGGKRCERCFNLRLKRTAIEAKERGFDYFATTLTLSPLKNAQLINKIGFEVAEEVGVSYLPSDFKKRGGYLRSLELSRQYNLYRQTYCGCEYSK